MLDRLSPVVKNLLIINVLAFLATWVFRSALAIDLNDVLGLHFFQASNFGVWQFFTYMFLHGSFAHLFFNMFSLYMFGSLVEYHIGARRFLIYYLVTGVGAGIVQQLAQYYELSSLFSAVDSLLSNITKEGLENFISSHGYFSPESFNLMTDFVRHYNEIVGSSQAESQAAARSFLMSYQQMYVDMQVTVGASGAVFGLLLAAGMLMPDMRVMLLFPPIPLKMKWMVLGYGVIELFCGVANFQYDNVAHWAHLGGMLFGFLLLHRWIRRSWR